MRDTGKNKIELIFIRHGKTKGNLEGRYIGKTDESLCETGCEDIMNRKYPDTKAVFASPMKRCLETSNLIYPKIEPIIIDEFREMDFGDFEGKNYNELNGNADYQKFIDSGGKSPFPNAETREEFIKRVLTGYEKMTDIIKNQNILQAAVIVHGGTIMAILSEILGGDYFDYQVKNGEIYRCSITL